MALRLFFSFLKENFSSFFFFFTRTSGANKKRNSGGRFTLQYTKTIILNVRVEKLGNLQYSSGPEGFRFVSIKNRSIQPGPTELLFPLGSRSGVLRILCTNTILTNTLFIESRAERRKKKKKNEYHNLRISSYS